MRLFYQFSLILFLMLPSAMAATGFELPYHGTVRDDSGNLITGSKNFKFALINQTATTTYWTNDGSRGPLPDQAVSIQIDNGNLSVLLGDTSINNMTSLQASVFANTDVYLRIWVESTTTPGQYDQLSQDKKMTASPFAFQAHALSTTNLDGVSLGTTTPAPANITNLSVTGQGNISGLLYPSNDGTGGQFLKTDGSGILSFATPSSTGDTFKANNEIITGNWVNTVHPWSDNEVSDALSITSGVISNSPISGSSGSFTNLSASLDTSLSANLTVLGQGNISGYLYPSTGGTQGQVIQTNGQGVLSWVSLNSISLSTAETIAADWVNTANPWSDNEVADNLSIIGGNITNTPISGSLGSFSSLAVQLDTQLSGNLIVTGQGNISGYLYPSTGGTSGQILQTDGQGNLSWVTPANATLGAAETITGDWINTSNPWSDNEVSDALTITSGNISNTPISGSSGSFTSLSASSLLSVSDTSDSSSTTTGAISTAGGLGVSKHLYVGLGAIINESGINSDTRIESQNNTSMLYVDANADMIGIGTATPASTLDIDSNSNTQALRLRGLDESNEIVDMYVNAQGGFVLDLTPGNDNSQFFDIRTEDDMYGIVLRRSNGASNPPWANFYVLENGDHDYLSININSATDTDALVISASDQIGIGRVPTYKLDVSGNAHVSSNLHLGQNIVLSEQSNSPNTISGNGSIYTKTDGNLYFKSSSGTEFDLSTQYLSSLGSGNLYLATGNLGLGDASPMRAIDIYNASSNAEVQIKSGTGYAYMMLDAANNSNAKIQWLEGGNEKFSLYHEGTSDKLKLYNHSVTEEILTVSGNKIGIGESSPTYRLTLPNTSGADGGEALAYAWLVYSSKRYKDNIQEIPNALAKIRLMRGVTYDSHQQHGGAKQIGFIAEEVGAILPEIVAWETNQRDAISMDYTRIPAVNLQAIKELDASQSKQHELIQKQEDKIIQQNQEIKLLKKRLQMLESLILKNQKME